MSLYKMAYLTNYLILNKLVIGTTIAFTSGTRKFLANVEMLWIWQVKLCMPLTLGQTNSRQPLVAFCPYK
jgi:hypothetical protein